MRLLFGVNIFSLAGFIFCWGKDDVNTIINTHQGPLEGVVLTTRGGRDYYAYKGVPYAVYPGRFKTATKFAKWNHILPANDWGPECAQVDMWKMKEYKGSENCLFLNVFTPNPNPARDARLPVFFYIPGGALTSTASTVFDGKYMLDEDIVVVSVNYRLGPLGFFTLGTGLDDDVPGNLGLKDQVLALKWVQRNIEFFGGDPAKVTVGGFSGGAAAAHHHTLSPLSQGLFRACIARGGTAVSTWAFQKFPREISTRFAKSIGCPALLDDDSNVKDVVGCLEKKSVQELIRGQVNVKDWHEYPLLPFTAVIEPEGAYGGYNFIVKSPRKELKALEYNPVPVMFGINRHEENLLAYPVLTDEKRLWELNHDWDRIAPIILGYTHWTKPNQTDGNKDLKRFFFPRWQKEGLSNQSVIAFFMDTFFVEPMDMAIRIQSQVANVYPFIVNFKAEYSIMNHMFGLEGFHGVTHGDGLQYLFPGGGYGAPDYSENTTYKASLEFSKKLIKMIASFVTDLEPKRWDNEPWVPTRNQDKDKLINYLALSNDIDVFIYPGRIERLQAFRYLRKWDIYDVNITTD